MNLYIIVFIVILIVLYNIQSNIFNEITYSNTYTIGITNNINIVKFTNTFLKIVNKKMVNKNIIVKVYENNTDLLTDINSNKIEYGICNETEVIESHLGLNSYSDNKLNSIRFITGLFYNYQYFLTDIFYKDSSKSSEITSINDLKDFYQTYNRHFIIGTEDKYSDSFKCLMILLNVYDFIPVDIETLDKTKKYDKNTIFYQTYDIDNLITKFNSNLIDGLFIINIYNYGKIRTILDKKNVIFLDLSYEKTIFNDLFSNYYYNKNITIANFSEDIDSTYTFNTKVNRIILITNDRSEDSIVEKLIKTYYTNNNYLINNLLSTNETTDTTEHTTFEPIDMIYINKFIKIHDSAYKYMESLGFIIDEGIKGQIDLNNNDKYNHYWKYDKIGINSFTLVD